VPEVFLRDARFSLIAVLLDVILNPEVKYDIK